jgi:hypothetical protein
MEFADNSLIILRPDLVTTWVNKYSGNLSYLMGYVFGAKYSLIFLRSPNPEHLPGHFSKYHK